MPEISPLGWLHTIIAIFALLSGLYSLIKYKVIQTHNRSGFIYIFCTLIAALTALLIYRHGGFGLAHGLAILTLTAVFVGLVAEKTIVFGKYSPFLAAISFSATFLFHMVPAITDGLMRLPVDAPIVSNIEDPLLKGFYLAFLLIYIFGTGYQLMWLRKQ